MTDEKISYAIPRAIIAQVGWYVRDNDNIIFPYGEDISYISFGSEYIVEEDWKAYWWNPPFTLQNKKPDPNASEKPTWQMLLNAMNALRKNDFRDLHTQNLKMECKKRIIENYDADDLEDEILKRLRNDVTSEQDMKRDRLRTKYQQQKAWVASATQAQLETYDPTADSLWED